MRDFGSVYTVAVIPARGGSVAVPKKNIKLLNGRPLIEYTIAAALASTFVDAVIVSTDSQEIADIAKEAGADVPFLRPGYLGTDDIMWQHIMSHSLRYLENSEAYGEPEIMMLLSPTYPFRDSKLIDASIYKMLSAGLDACLSVQDIRKSLLLRLGAEGYEFLTDKREMFSPRQRCHPLYKYHYGLATAVSTFIVRDCRMPSDQDNIDIILPDDSLAFLDINTTLDFEVAEMFMAKQQGRESSSLDAYAGNLDL